MSENQFVVWARQSSEPQARVRAKTAYQVNAENEARRIAKSSGEAGAVSVWVEDRRTGRVVWAAGEKAEDQA